MLQDPDIAKLNLKLPLVNEIVSESWGFPFCYDNFH
jgi:hypothetical protein